MNVGLGRSLGWGGGGFFATYGDDSDYIPLCNKIDEKQLDFF